MSSTDEYSRTTAARSLVLSTILASACGDSTATSASETTNSATSITSATATIPTTGSGGETTPTSSGSMSASDSEITTDTPTSDATAMSSTSTTGGVTASSTGSTGATTGSSDTSTGDEGCGGLGGLGFSYIWIANSAQSTVSKIDTKTGVELGRYATNGAPNGNPIGGPSRTSVSVTGDVVVADRQGHLVKFFALEERCVDKNNNGLIDTSNSDIPLPFGQDECLAWSVDVKSAYAPLDIGAQAGPRIAQWTAPSECKSDDAKVWLGWCDETASARVQLRDGKDGALLFDYPLGFQCFVQTYGPYGGVVDENNGLWISGRTSDRSPNNGLYHIPFGCDPDMEQCVSHYIPPVPIFPYGINISGTGEIWLAGQPMRLVRYDPATETWTDHSAEVTAAAPAGSSLLRGLVIDMDGVAWVALGNSQVGIGPNPRLIRVDPSAQPASVTVWGPETIKELLNPVGMSIDADGYLWTVDSAANKAYKIDRADPTKYTVVSGLLTPYTYSDMTGYALSLVVPG